MICARRIASFLSSSERPASLPPWGSPVDDMRFSCEGLLLLVLLETGNSESESAAGVWKVPGMLRKLVVGRGLLVKTEKRSGGRGLTCHRGVKYCSA